MVSACLAAGSKIRVNVNRQSLGPLSERPFRLLWLAQTISSAGTAFATVAVAFAVLGLRGSATSLGLVLTAGAVTRLVFLLLGGVWGDRLPRKQVMIVADTVRLCAQAAIAVMLLTGYARIWHVAVANIIVSAASGVFLPASTGLVAQTVSAPRLQRANGLLSISNNTASLAGPALSGILIATVGAGWSYAVDAASFAGSVICLAAMPALSRAGAARQHWLLDLAEGWRELATRRWCWLNLIGHALWNLAMGVLLVLGPVAARAYLGGAVGWGLVSAGLSAGALTGGLITLHAVPRRPLVTGNLALALGGLPLLALAARQPLYVVVMSAVAAFAGMSFMNSLWTTALQQLAPPGVLARISSYDNLVSYAILPAGYGLAGPVALAAGTGPALCLAAVLMVVPSVFVALLPSVRAVERHQDGVFTAGIPQQRIPG
jgi:MFS family permease